MKKNVCIVGGGSLGHVTAGWLAHEGNDVTVLTRRPGLWADHLTLVTLDGDEFSTPLARVTSKAEEAIPEADVVLLTVPGNAIRSELEAIAPWLRPETFVGGVFCSSGFFFEAKEVLPAEARLWGFQRVPFIARTLEYGHSGQLRGFRSQFNVAIENVSPRERETFAAWIAEAFGAPVNICTNYLEASITNSNPILHTSRLYSLFKDWTPDTRSDHNILFYEEWSDKSSELLIAMDTELFRLIDSLPVNPRYLTPLLEYYESTDASSLTRKLASIEGFKGIGSPMIADERGWKPDYTSRYFTEDFGYSLRHIVELARQYSVDIPVITRVFDWGLNCITRS